MYGSLPGPSPEGMRFDRDFSITPQQRGSLQTWLDQIQRNATTEDLLQVKNLAERLWGEIRYLRCTAQGLNLITPLWINHETISQITHLDQNNQDNLQLIMRFLQDPVNTPLSSRFRIPPALL